MADLKLTGPQFIASVINGAPAEQRSAVCEAINGMDAETRELEIRAAVGFDTPEAPEGDNAEMRKAREKAANLAFGMGADNGDDEPSWRGLMPSRSEWRGVLATGVPGDGGYTAPTETASKLRDRIRARSIFLAAGPREIRMQVGQMVLPTLTASNSGGKVAEATAIPKATLTFTGPQLQAVGYKGFVEASAEILDDNSVDLRNRIGEILAADIAEAIDTTLLSATSVAGDLKGLFHTSNSVNTTLATGQTKASWDAVIDAYARLESGNVLSDNVVILAAPDAAAFLRKERENGTTGAYMASSIGTGLARNAFGSRMLVSPHVPAGKFAVVNMDYVYVGIRKDVSVAVSEQFGFDRDVVAFRAVQRIAGVDVQSPVACQLVTPSAT